MNFFQAQENARKTTRRLVLWFFVTIAAMITTFYLLTMLVMKEAGESTQSQQPYNWIDYGVLLIVTIIVGGIILGSSTVKLAALSQGGSVVAKELGGRPVDEGTLDPLERRLRNVVEEMSIASGVPMPEVWILDNERGINAFAAGTDPGNAVVAVTRGCLRRLNRDELQGVIGHEFSHILNGDMKLNVRLIGLVFGLVVIAMLGRIILQSSRYMRVRSSSSKDSGSVILVIILLGVLTWAIGSLGVLFGRILQAAVSRQREHLADASAVQFTRNPEGLAAALRKIGGFSIGGTLETANAEASRHLFLANSSRFNLGLATHPPLADRIRALLPNWDGTMLPSVEMDPFSEEIQEEEKQHSRNRFPGGRGLRRIILAGAMMGDGYHEEKSAETVSSSADASADKQEAVSDMPDRLQSRVEAKALLLGLLLTRKAEDAVEHQQGLDLIRQQLRQNMADRAAHWSALMAGKTAKEINQSIDYALPYLRRMERHEAQQFIDLSNALIRIDGHISLFEFMIAKIIERYVAIGTGLQQVARIRYHSLADYTYETAVLIGALARYNQKEGVFEAAQKRFYELAQKELSWLSLEKCTLEEVAKALLKFEEAAPPVKSQLLQLCKEVAEYDGVLVEEEAQFLRAFSDAIGAPLFVGKLN